MMLTPGPGPAPEEALVYSLIVPDPDGVEPSGAELKEFLSPLEMARHERYLVQRKKNEFFLARKFAKTLLGQLLNISPGKIEFKVAESGKPFLWLHGRAAPLRFNISHTAGLIACAFSYDCELGVDVECLADPRDNLAERFFHPCEVEEYGTLDQAGRARRFCQLWTLKEAYLKATGHGFSVPLNSFWFSFPAENGSEGLEIHFDRHPKIDHAACYQFFQGQPSPEHLLAVAVKTRVGVRFTHQQYLLNDNGSLATSAGIR
jgi:4'-phosphopantetheinyl transferase